MYSVTTVYSWGDTRQYHHACAVQQWCHYLTVCVKASREHFEYL